MQDKNELEGYNTVQFGKYEKDAFKAVESCPTAEQAFKNPIRIVDYVGCHKITVVFLLVLFAFVLYATAATVKKAQEGDNKEDGK